MLYIKEAQPSGSSLSGGAIAGLAVAGTAALAAAATLLLVWRRRRRRRASLAAKPQDGVQAVGVAADGDGSTPPPPQQPSQQQPSQQQSSQQQQQQQQRSSNDSVIELSPFKAAAATGLPFEAFGAPAAQAACAGSMPPPLSPAGRGFSGPASSLDAAAVAAAAVAGPAAPTSVLRAPSTPSRSSPGGAALPAPRLARAASALPLSRGSTLASSGSLVPAGGGGGGGGGGSSGGAGAGAGRQLQRQVLPELLRHVAAQEAVVATSGLNMAAGAADTSSDEASASATATASASASAEHVPLSVGALPPALRQWVVQPGEVEFPRGPNGRRQELGSGAR